MQKFTTNNRMCLESEVRKADPSSACSSLSTVYASVILKNTACPFYSGRKQLDLRLKLNLTGRPRPQRITKHFQMTCFVSYNSSVAFLSLLFTLGGRGVMPFTSVHMHFSLCGYLQHLHGFGRDYSLTASC